MGFCVGRIIFRKDFGFWNIGDLYAVAHIKEVWVQDLSEYHMCISSMLQNILFYNEICTKMIANW